MSGGGQLNPSTILTCMLLAGLALTGSYLQGRADGADSIIASQANDEKIRRDTILAADEGAARAISRLEVKNVTIRQNTQTIVREVPVYRECKHDRRVLDNINASLSGSESPGPSQLPTASTPGR